MKQILQTVSLITLGLNTPLIAQESFTTSSIKELITNHIMENPELIEKAFIKLNEKKVAAKKEKQKEVIHKAENTLYKGKNPIILGSLTAKNTIALFIDPYCGYCKKYHVMLKEALATDASLKIIIKAIPLFGEPSEHAILALLAAHAQGKYFEFYEALSEKTTPQSEENLLDIARTVKGLNIEAFKQDVKSKNIHDVYAQDRDLAHALELEAAPSLIIGTDVIEGAAPLTMIKDALAAQTLPSNVHSIKPDVQPSIPDAGAPQEVPATK